MLTDDYVMYPNFFTAMYQFTIVKVFTLKLCFNNTAKHSSKIMLQTLQDF